MLLFKVEVHLANTASSQALHWNNHSLTNNQIKHKGGEKSQLAGGKPVGYLQAWLRSWTRYRETNSAGGRSGTRTRDLRVASLTHLPLGHAAPEKTSPSRNAEMPKCRNAEMHQNSLAVKLWLFFTHLLKDWFCPVDDLKSVFSTIHLELNALPVSSTWYDLKFLSDK